MVQTIQPSFGKGEVAPSLYGRVDTQMYDVALKTARNVLIHTHGGASNRGGLRYLAPCMSMNQASRLIDFQFNTTDKYILEFGDQKMRVIRNDAHVVTNPQIIEGITRANPGVVTITGHGYTNGQEIYLTDIVGMVELNGRRFKVAGAAANTFQLASVFTGALLDTTNYTAWSAGGTAALIYEITTPYLYADLAELKYVQSADVMTFTHKNYDIRELSRTDHDQWTFSIPTFAPATAYPTNVAVTAGSVGNYRARYKVTAVADDESLPGVATAVAASGHQILTITGITQANPGEVTVTPNHGLPTNAKVFISGVVGMTEVNNLYFTITNTAANKFTIGVNTTGYGAYVSGGTAYRTFEALTQANPVVITETTHDLATDDEIEIQGVVAPTNLNGRRFLVNKLTADTFSLRDEDGTLYDAFTNGGYYYKTFGEVRLNNITGITQANPAVVTIGAGHGIQNGVIVKIAGVAGMTQVNDRQYTTAGATNTTVQLANVDSTGYGAWTSGGSLWQDNTARNVITWTAVAGAAKYRIYKEKNGRYGFVGSTDALSFTEDNIAPDTLQAPPSLRNPFFGEFNRPATVSYFEQRRVFGGSIANPDTTYYSVIGAPKNFTVHDPIQDDDAITITLASRQVNEIRHFVPLSDLLIMTSGSEWRAATGPDSVFSPTNAKQKPQTVFGTGHLRPLVSGNTIIYAEETNALVRTLTYDFQIDGFTGSDIGLLANHLLYDTHITDWAWQASPDNRAYAVRSDGKLLTITYDTEQQVTAWTRWDTRGDFESVATLRRGLGEHHDGVYTVVHRAIAGIDVRFIEKLDQSAFVAVEDAFFVDAGATYDNPKDIQSVTFSGLGTVTVHAVGHGLVNGNFADISDIEWVSVFDEHFTESQPDQLNGGRFVVSAADADTFVATGANSTGWTQYKRYGKVRKAVTQVIGPDHLEGETNITALLDGNAASNLTVVNGIMTLPRPTSRVQFGLRYIADLETLDIDLPTQSGSAQGMRKKVNFVVVKFERTRGLDIGPDEQNLVEMKQRENEAYDEPTALLTGNTKPIFLLPSWNSNGRVFLRQRYPLPFTVLAIVPNLEIGSREDNS